MYGYTVGGRMSARRLRLDRAGEQMDLEGSFNWDSEGRLTRITYPAAAKSKTDQPYWEPVPGPVVSYTYDSMGRPATLTNDGAELGQQCGLRLGG
jgi:hypothetical protein